MMDQAETLRNIEEQWREGSGPVSSQETPEGVTLERVENASSPAGVPEKERVEPVRVLAVTSGKGGMGKTNIVASLAVAFSKMGKRVLVLDADLALGNIDVLFGVIPKFTMEDVLLGQKGLADIIIEGPCGVCILPTGSGAEGMADLSAEQKMVLFSELDRLETSFDIFLIDTAAGISSNVLYFNAAAQEILVVASSEPTSLTDAYAIIKVLSRRYQEKRFRLLVNMVQNDAEAQSVFRKLTVVADRYLNVAIDYVGYIPYDDHVKMAVSRQKAVMDAYPNAKSSQTFMRIARQILQWPIPTQPKGTTQFFLKTLLSQKILK